jgi:hypothetical protein
VVLHFILFYFILFFKKKNSKDSGGPPCHIDNVVKNCIFRWWRIISQIRKIKLSR